MDRAIDIGSDGRSPDYLQTALMSFAAAAILRIEQAEFANKR